MGWYGEVTSNFDLVECGLCVGWALTVKVVKSLSSWIGIDDDDDDDDDNDNHRFGDTVTC
jgi:hypothetical protein